MNMTVEFWVVLIVCMLVGAVVGYAIRMYRRNARKKDDTYIYFQTINGKRTAILHMSDPPMMGADDEVLEAFKEAIHKLYNDHSLPSEDFQLAWEGYLDFRESINAK